MIGKPGPFRIINSDLSGSSDDPAPAPRRRYQCPNYNSCLDLAAALNWDNFTCRGCCGEIDQSLLWCAFHALKKDKVVSKICKFPAIEAITNEPAPPLKLKVAKG